MLIATASGALGKDAEYKRTQGDAEFCSFSVATENGYGDRKVTQWVDVTKWGKGSEGLTKLLTKGRSVTVIGELTTREHNGKTYLQLRADHVKLGSGGNSASSGPPTHRNQNGFGGSKPPVTDELDDSVPFATCDPTWERRVS